MDVTVAALPHIVVQLAQSIWPVLLSFIIHFRSTSGRSISYSDTSREFEILTRSQCIRKLHIYIRVTPEAVHLIANSHTVQDRLARVYDSNNVGVAVTAYIGFLFGDEHPEFTAFT